MIFPHYFQIGIFTLNLETRFLLGGKIVTPCPDTLAVGPDTPDMEFLVHVIFVLWAPQLLKQGSHPLSLPPSQLTLPLPLTCTLSLSLVSSLSLSLVP